MRILIRIGTGRSKVVAAKYPKTMRTEPLKPDEKEMLQKVNRLIEAILEPIQDMSDGELSKRQGELYRLVKKILHEPRYALIRARVRIMVSDLQANGRAAILRTIPELRPMV